MLMKEYRFILLYLLSVILVSCCILYTCGGKEEVEVIKSDTIVIYDTIIDSQPVVVHDTLLRWKKISVRDTLRDTILDVRIVNGSIEIPISQRIYTDDTTYRAWVSGYDPRLDSIHVYRKNVIIDTQHFFRKKGLGFHFGVQGGDYLTPEGFQPGVGFGISYGF